MHLILICLIVILESWLARAAFETPLKLENISGNFYESASPLAVSEDGKLLLTLAAQQIEIWDLEKKVKIKSAPLAIRRGDHSRSGFLKSDSLIFVAGQGVQFFNWPDLTEVNFGADLSAKWGVVDAIDVSQDGQLVFMIHGNGYVQVFRKGQNEPVLSTEYNPGSGPNYTRPRPEDANISADGRFFGAGFKDEVVIWKADGDKEGKISINKSPFAVIPVGGHIRRLQVSAKAKYLAASVSHFQRDSDSNSEEIVLVDLETKSIFSRKAFLSIKDSQGVWRNQIGFFSGFRFGPGDSFLTPASFEGPLYQFEVPTLKEQNHWANEGCSQISLVLNGKSVFCGSPDGKLSKIDLASKSALKLTDSNSIELKSLDFSEDDGWVYGKYSVKVPGKLEETTKLAVWDAKTGKIKASGITSENSERVTISDGGEIKLAGKNSKENPHSKTLESKYFVAADSDVINIYDNLASDAWIPLDGFTVPDWNPKLPNNPILERESKDGRYVAISFGTLNDSLLVWDMKAHKKRKVIKCNDRQATVLHSFKKGLCIPRDFKNESISLFDPLTGKWLEKMNGPDFDNSEGWVISPDDRWLALKSDQSYFYLLNLKSGETVKRNTDGISAEFLSFSHDSSRFATGDRKGTILIWQAPK